LTVRKTQSVAIVGIGAIFPDAPDPGRFWDNIRHGRSAAREVPAGKWRLPADSLYDPEPGKADRVYSRRGCFIDDLPPLSLLSGLNFDPESLAELDPLFHLLLHAGKRAFDSGVTAPLDRSRIGVIVGNLVLPSEKSALLARNILGRTFAERVTGRPPDRLSTDPLNRYTAGLPAGLLAHGLGLGGGSCTLDAACASSLYAIKLAVDELLSGRADAMLTGGVSRPDPLYTQMGFSQLRALSPRGICSPFDAAADGLVVGEGAGIFLLKRTEDAVAHGDRVYGVIRGIGLANDVGGSLLAPLSEGQLRAMRQAYEKSGWKPGDVDMVECHATGTQVGDATEFASLRQLWGETGPEGERCVLGSVKSNIGHLLTAAGAAALTKVLLAMDAGILPPTANFSAPPPSIDLENSPFRVLTGALPWERRGNGIPRRAAVSAFGFGGINGHLLVEEWLPKVPVRAVRPGKMKKPEQGEPIAVVGMDACFGPWQTLRSFQERVLGGDRETSPSLPDRWWGAEESAWFRDEGLQQSRLKGYYMDAFDLDIEQFRIPPKEMEEMLPQQILMLRVAAGAMADAGMDRAENLRGGVFVGIPLDLNTTNYSFRWSLAEQAALWARELAPEMTADEVAAWGASLRDAAGPPLTANRTMGGLGSIVASRIAREFRIGGPSFTISSEENSGIRALETAVRMLQSGELDRALVGAVDMAGDLRALLAHHAVRPLSPSGRCLPFDQQGDGSLMGEGGAAVVLKRLDDAVKDGDRIYAVIRGIGGSGGDTLLPGAESYLRALERAYADAGVEPATISYLEAGAGGSPGEDRMEARALSGFFTRGKRQFAVAAVKGEIGHCGAASGLASFVRACLCLYQEIIPGACAVDNPIAGVEEGSPFYFPATPRYWLRNRGDGPRRAGVSSFGMDGGCAHVVLEGWENQPESAGEERIAPLGPVGEHLFIVTGADRAELSRGLELLSQRCKGVLGGDIASIAGEWPSLQAGGDDKALAIAMVARQKDELGAMIERGMRILANGGSTDDPIDRPSLRDRLFWSFDPLGRSGKIAFVFPGSGNHYPAMGREISALWPDLFRLRDRENLYLAGQIQPGLFWNGAPLAELDRDPEAVIFGQVAAGCAVSDVVRMFGIQPRAVIGYSLGESAGLFATGAWRDRDGMLERMRASTLFTRDLAGECLAARSYWGLGESEKVEWAVGVVDLPAAAVKKALSTLSRVYLLIVNTPSECVIGGDRGEVERLVSLLGCRYFPLHGVTTVHCPVAGVVAAPYRDLHLFETTPHPGASYYSGAWGRPYRVTPESAADSILAQAENGIDFPRVIEAAYGEGARIFIEMGPGSSCSRMIGAILQGRPHVARSACHQGVDPASAILRLLGRLVAERVAVNLLPIYGAGSVSLRERQTGNRTREPFMVRFGGKPFTPPLPQLRSKPLSTPVGEKAADAYIPAGMPPLKMTDRADDGSIDPLLRQFACAQDSLLKAHDAYLRFSERLTASIGKAMALQFSIQEALDASGGCPEAPLHPLAADIPISKENEPLFGRDMCMEFATGSVGRMLGPQFSEADRFPTRVRLPGEPLMLVDRIMEIEGEPRSMTGGRVVTEHDILPGAWYLDAGRIPTCIAVEAGQADLFLSGYLGIDFITRGLAVYRLLDAVVTFHRGLPLAGETIRYDIGIERFFQQGETRYFRFRFDATVGGAPLLTMREGCAGFFTAKELEAGKGIVRSAIDLRPKSGTLPADWEELVPMAAGSYDGESLDRLREGDLAGCFGPQFSALKLSRPLTIPGGRMRLVHRVTELNPGGGSYGLGVIRAEADIRPDDWFLTCHFVDDRVMPGTLMYECCLHTLRIYLLRAGWLAEAAGAAWEPVPGVASRLSCRGQVLETTSTVGYEVNIRELGYRPEPFAIVDALMYADGKAIVEITSMSLRLTGTTKEKLTALWRSAGALPAPPQPPADGGMKPAIYTKEQILAYSNGNPSEGFGEPYRPFDGERIIARLPGPPYQFMDRVTAVTGEPWQMAAGAGVEAQYDIPADAWYFAAERQQQMPFAVLLEAALQPCGWLAAYVGSALTSPIDLSFRNLGGNAVLHRPLLPDSGTVTASATLKKVSTSGGMIIQEYDFTVSDRIGPVYEGETMFGFFTREALANQVGIRDAVPYRPTADETARGTALPFPESPPFPDRMLRMIDRIDLFVPDGGPGGLGYIRGTKVVDPDEWFFKAHFYQDPVTPGSLGLESFLQLLKYAVVKRWGWREGNTVALAEERRHSWLYRGQILPSDKSVTVEAWITSQDEAKRSLTGDGILSVDGRLIYRMNDFTLKME
jgi:acyl transferase domain-containing protein/3-hydroxymyristoyl/3-hydroxydecanoyl-(acyl carrier protein) dehydratase